MYHAMIGLFFKEANKFRDGRQSRQEGNIQIKTNSFKDCN